MAQAIKPMEHNEESDPSLSGPVPHPSSKTFILDVIFVKAENRYQFTTV